MGKQHTKPYASDALKHLGKCMTRAREHMEREGKFPSMRINLEGLEKAIKVLPKEERQNIEKFWGLTGGTNHSKKNGLKNSKDVAYKNLFYDASKSVRRLFKVDYIRMFDENLHLIVQLIINKVNKNGVTYISDFEAIKYILAFFIIVWNGPKMLFDDEPMSIDTSSPGDSICDEYAMLYSIYLTLEEYPDNSVNLELLVNLFEMMDFQDMLVIKKSMGIEIPEDCCSKQIENIHTHAETRAFKEKVFEYGAWDVTTELIMGKNLNLEMFMRELNMICRNWSRMEEFKTGQKNLKTSTEIRTLDVYTIGGLEFTDPYEVMFLYLERNLIEPKA